MFKKALLPLLVMCTTVTEAQAAYSYSSFPPPGSRTVHDVMQRYSPFVEPRIKRYFEQVGVAYPPQNIALFAMKDEMALELWAQEKGKWTYVKRYDIEKISGRHGPKLREGDKQVPEGIYRVSLLNPNSRFHLSMKLDYPNAFDRKYAYLEGRTALGGNIFIHGKEASTGCLAMGDYNIEELFLLANRTGIDNIEVVISPYDPRRGKLVAQAEQPFWTQILYRDIEQASKKFGR